MAANKKDHPTPLPTTTSTSRPLHPPCQIRRRSDLFLLWIGICIFLLAAGHIYLHNPHAPHLELKRVGGVHGSLEGFVTDGRRGKAGKASKEKDLGSDGSEHLEESQHLVEEVEKAVAQQMKDIKRYIREQPKSQTAAVSEKKVEVILESAQATTATVKPSSKPSAAPTKSAIANSKSSETNNQSTHKIINPSDSIHPVAHLSCTDHGGPSDPKIIDEMVFWSDIPSDASFISPMYEPETERYLTFEPDHGGWNNIRMAMETALVLSHAMGRTLVLPPEQGMYLIDKGGNNQKSRFSFNDFFHLDAIALEHRGFKVITTEEFLKREALTGGLKDYYRHTVKYPPENRTDYNGRGRDALFEYLRSVANTPSWDPWECAVAIPATREQSSVDLLNSTLRSIMDGSYGKPKPTLEEFNGHPTPVDAPLAERMREMLADRPGLCIYDKELQEEKLIHLKVQGGVRLLTHFYAFIFFEDWKQDLWSKRFVRDHLRYVDEIMCAAARVVEAVREHARKNKQHKPSMEEGVYDAMHVRRGDFQYTPTRLPADQLFDLSKNEFTEGATLYVATDEKDKTFFQPFKDKYDVVFLDDFMHVIPDVNTNYYGMIDQLVSYKSRVFYGTWWSTLSGYVNRMRGYYITKHKLEGWEDGTMKSWYFTPEERRLQMRSYIPIRKPIYCKEFAIAWRDIDKDIDDSLENPGSSLVQPETNLLSSKAAPEVKLSLTEAVHENDINNQPIKTASVAYVNSHKIINPSDSIHPVAHLSCADHGGPSDPKIIDEMVFWSDIPSDATFISPMYEEGNEKYLTFEPDHGGWNNIRMAMETALVLSHAMGRTLVLPPEQGMYLLGNNKEGQKSQFSFNDFFHLDAIAIEHKGFKVITTEEFLKREAITGGLKEHSSQKVKFPPGKRTNYDGPGRSRDSLYNYLRSIANTPTWDPWECAVAIPATKEQSSVDLLNNTLHSIMDGSYGKPKPTLEEFNGHPTPVDAPMAERMREMLADRPGLCIYDKELQEEKVIHLKVQDGVRLLTHFYAFIFFEDWKQDLWSKRFVRDHLRYVDEIMCAAARVVEAVRDHARKNKQHKPSIEEGVYDAMHVRRGDFQYTPTRLPADQLFELSKNEFTEGATLYVATDEKDKTFFQPFKDKYDVVFLDDFMHVIPDINTNYYGMIDQLVSYKSRVFYGTWWSTLSGYVNRMRGYYITKHKLEGWEDGTMKSWYFTPEERRLQMRSYIPVRKPIYCKEFAVAWRDIDKGINEIP